MRNKNQYTNLVVDEGIKKKSCIYFISLKLTTKIEMTEMQKEMKRRRKTKIKDT